MLILYYNTILEWLRDLLFNLAVNWGHDKNKMKEKPSYSKSQLWTFLSSLAHMRMHCSCRLRNAYCDEKCKILNLETKIKKKTTRGSNL